MLKHTPELFEKGVGQISETQRLIADQMHQVMETSLNSTMRLIEINIGAAQDRFQRNARLIDEAKALKDGGDVVDFQEKVRQAETDALIGQSRQISDLFAQTQSAMEKIAKDGFRKANDTLNGTFGGTFPLPATEFLKQGLDAQRKAFDTVSELARANWEKGVEQMRTVTEQGAEQAKGTKPKGRKA